MTLAEALSFYLVWRAGHAASVRCRASGTLHIVHCPREKIMGRNERGERDKDPPTRPSTALLPRPCSPDRTRSGLWRSGHGQIGVFFCFLQVVVVAQPPSREDDDYQCRRAKHDSHAHALKTNYFIILGGTGKSARNGMAVSWAP